MAFTFQWLWKIDMFFFRPNKLKINSGLSNREMEKQQFGGQVTLPPTASHLEPEKTAFPIGKSFT